MGRLWRLLLGGTNAPKGASEMLAPACRAGTYAARALVRGTLRGAAATGHLAAPLVLGLLRTLALSRLLR